MLQSYFVKCRYSTICPIFHEFLQLIQKFVVRLQVLHKISVFLCNICIIINVKVYVDL